MNYLVKIDDWENEMHEYVTVKCNKELSSVLKRIPADAIVNVTPLHGTVYTSAQFINNTLDK